MGITRSQKRNLRRSKSRQQNYCHKQSQQWFNHHMHQQLVEARLNFTEQRKRSFSWCPVSQSSSEVSGMVDCHCSQQSHVLKLIATHNPYDVDAVEFYKDSNFLG